MKTMLLRHRQISPMMAQMNQQMRQMSMAADPQWSALVDSLRQDQIACPR